MALVTTPHTHPCPYGEPHEADCQAARRGGCLFASYEAITCEPCAAREVARLRLTDEAIADHRGAERDANGRLGRRR